MASKIRNIELLRNVFGEDAEYILKKLDKDNIKLTNRSSNFVYNISNIILNYIDFIYEGNKSIIEDKTIDEIESEYNDWLENGKTNYSMNFIPKDEHILFDYRINGIGLYWVDLKSNHSSEMVFNMDNCGRVGVSQNIIVLREQKESGENLMQVAMSISNDFFICQIKGRGTGKPILFYTQILDFLLKYEPIIGFKQVFKPEDDFNVHDLKNEDKLKLKLVKPHLFNKII